MTSKVWDKQHGGSHYRKYKIQPSQFISENELLYPEGCAIKYIIRHRDKGKKQDEEHRVWYVGVTRAKQNLYFIAGKNKERSYDIESLG